LRKLALSAKAPQCGEGAEQMPRNTEDQVQIVTRVSPDLHHRLKAHAAIEGTSMNEVVIRAVDAVVLRDLESVRQAAAIK
jgi:predicted HicB family RNase H-like nuclease